MASIRDRSTGFSTKQLLNVDYDTFNSWDEKQLRRFVTQLSSAANKKLRTFEKAGEQSPATSYVKRSGGKFSTRGKSFGELRHEYMRIKSFYKAETSDIKKWRKIKADTIEELKKAGLNLGEKNFDKFWKVYERLKSIDRTVAEREFKYNVFDVIDVLIQDDSKSVDDLVEEIAGDLSEIYEEAKERSVKGNADISDYFDL